MATVSRREFSAKLYYVPGGEITELLKAWSAGDSSAIDRLAPLVYAQLHKVAHRRLRRERPDHTLDSTSLVHEAYLQLVRQKDADWQDRAHFFAIGGRIMRRILVDHARASRCEKRGDGARPLPLDDHLDTPARKSLQVMALDDALNDLEKLDPRQSRVVELRFFAGLSIEEAAEALHISKATVNRDWVTARAWLLRELSRA
jgi:RNA polymerase sigma factor (TIGR02999 family)